MKSRLRGKRVLIAVVSLFITAFVVIGVTVSVYIYTNSNVEVLKVRHAFAPVMLTWWEAFFYHGQQ